MKTERIYPIRNFGSIMAPFYHVIALLIFALGAAAFGLLLHKPMRGIIEKVEESKRESDVML